MFYIKYSFAVLSCLFLVSCQTANSLYPTGYKENSITEFKSVLPEIISACLSVYDDRQRIARRLNKDGFVKHIRIVKGAEYISFSKPDIKQIEIKGETKAWFLSNLSVSFLNKKSSFVGCSVNFISHPDATDQASGEILGAIGDQGYKLTDINSSKKITTFSYQKKTVGLLLYQQKKRFKNRSLIQYTIIKLPFELPLIEPKKPAVYESSKQVSSKSNDGGIAARAENSRIANQQATAHQQRIQQQQQVFINQSRARNPAPPTGLRQ